jgi:hypothetical protein
MRSISETHFVHRATRNSVTISRNISATDAGAHFQAVSRFLPDDARTVFAAVFEDGARRHPQLLNLDAAFALVLECVLKPEEIAGAAAMVTSDADSRGTSGQRS